MKPLFAIFLLFLMGCSQHEAPKPKLLLDEETMLDIMFDLAIIQAVKSTGDYVLADNTLETNMILKDKYQIDEKIWFENNIYYASNIRKYNQMVKKVQDRFETKKLEMEEKETKIIDKKKIKTKRIIH